MAQFTEKPGFSFSKAPPKDALAWFRSKGLKVGFDHRDVYREEHARAFTVAKAMSTDVLASIRKAVDQALADGRTFREFARDLAPELQKQGWWGRKEMTDPVTGEVRKYQLGSPRRLATIYRTNMRTARAAGQWARIQRTTKSHPFLVYELGPSREHRPEHEAWAGTMLPVDDPWWTTHMPPNGWGCKCRVRQVSRGEAERLKGAGRVRTEAPPVKLREWTNVRTGQIHQVPEGIDPGWDYNPGAAGRLADGLEHLTKALDGAATDVATTQIRALTSGPLLAEWMEARPGGDFPVAILDRAALAQLGATSQVARLSGDTFDKQLARHPELTPAEYALIQDTVERGTRVQDTPRSLMFVFEAEQGRDGYVSVVKTTRTGHETYLTSFRRLSRDQARRDKEIRRIMKKEEKGKADGGASH